MGTVLTLQWQNEALRTSQTAAVLLLLDVVSRNLVPVSLQKVKFFHVCFEREARWLRFEICVIF